MTTLLHDLPDGKAFLTAPETALALGHEPRAIYVWLERDRFPGAIRTPDGHLAKLIDIAKAKREVG